MIDACPSLPMHSEVYGVSMDDLGVVTMLPYILQVGPLTRDVLP